MSSSPKRFPEIPRFPSPLRLEEVDSRRWKVLEDFLFVDGVGRTWRVPAGFVTDLASVPRALWGLYPPFGSYEDAAVVHDFMYTYQSTLSPEVDKGFADDHLMQGMVARGTGWLTRHAVYWGVKVGGGPAWRGHKADLASGKVVGLNPKATLAVAVGLADPNPPTLGGNGSSQGTA